MAMQKQRRGRPAGSTKRTSTRGKTATRRTGTRGGSQSGFVRVHLGTQLKSWIADPENRQQFDQWMLGLKPTQISGGQGRRGGQTGTRARKTTTARRNNAQQSQAA